MLIHGAIPTAAHYTLRLTSEEFQNREMFQLCLWTCDTEGGALRATRTGVVFSAVHLPALRAALQHAERMMLRAGLLSAADYRAAGEPPPVELQALQLVG